MPARARVIVEVDVDVERLAMTVLMRAATDIVRVVQQFRNTGGPGDLRRKFVALDHAIDSR
jgi:hypothetical protein